VAQRKTARKTSSKGRTSSPSLKKAASRKTKFGAKKTADAATRSAGEKEVTIDRRRAARRESEPVAEAGQSATGSEKLERRQKVNRRRQIDPTTCERDYTGDEIEFMNALDEYKRKSGRMFPTCSEVLEVVRSLGYVRGSAADLAAGEFGSHAAVAGSATTNWFACCGDSSESDDEAMLEAALTD
jgi:hypothetical protein